MNVHPKPHPVAANVWVFFLFSYSKVHHLNLVLHFRFTWHTEPAGGPKITQIRSTSNNKQAPEESFSTQPGSSDTANLYLTDEALNTTKVLAFFKHRSQINMWRIKITKTKKIKTECDEKNPWRYNQKKQRMLWSLVLHFSAETVHPKLLNTTRCFQREYIFPRMNNSRGLPLEQTAAKVKGGECSGWGVAGLRRGPVRIQKRAGGRGIKTKSTKKSAKSRRKGVIWEWKKDCDNNPNWFNNCNPTDERKKSLSQNKVT